MARLEKPEFDGHKPTISEKSRPDRGTVVEACRDMLVRSRRDPSFAADFVRNIAAPQSKWEDPHMAPVVGGGSRWEYAYQNRVLSSLNAYIAMSEDDRRLLHACIADGCKWRGEPIGQFVATCDEHLRMHEEGVDKYRKRVAESLDKYRKRNFE